MLDALEKENPVFKWSIITLLVFGPLYVLNSYGVKIAWPIALLIGLGMLVLSGWWKNISILGGKTNV